MPIMAQTIEDALTPIHDGIMLAVPREVAGVPMEATRALIRRGVRNLHLVTLPTSSASTRPAVTAASWPKKRRAMAQVRNTVNVPAITFASAAARNPA